MPTYEYICTKCGARLEVFQRITDPPRKRCSSCRGALRKVLSPGGGILLKGSGFYATDYRSESYRKAASAEKSAGGEKKADAGANPPKKKDAGD